MPFFVASGGLLLREFVKRVKPWERNGAALGTRGLHERPRRPTRRKARARPDEHQNPFGADQLRQRLGGFSARRTLSSATSTSQAPDQPW